MNYFKTFLQRLYKFKKKSNNEILRYIKIALGRIKEITQSAIMFIKSKAYDLLVNHRRRFFNNKSFIQIDFAKTNKRLLAVIMDFKVVVKCRMGITHFINKASRVVMYKYKKSTIATMEMVSSFVVVFMLTNVSHGMALAAGNDASAHGESRSCDVRNIILEKNLVVDERIAHILQNKETDGYYEDVVQGDYEVLSDIAIDSAYLSSADDKAAEEGVIDEAVQVAVVEGESDIALAQEEETTPEEQIEEQQTEEDTEQETAEALSSNEEQPEETADNEESVDEEETTTIDYRYDASSDEVALLARIVEAEAGDQDIKGRILVANVILNRVDSGEFPDNIEDVVYQKRQFSPVSDGRLWKVSVTSSSKEAANRALEGEDYSEGALYFVDRKGASKSNIRWFDNELTWLFKHGCHEFYK